MHQTDNYFQTGIALNEASTVIIATHGRGGSPEDMASLAQMFADERTCILAPRATNHTWYPYSFMAPRANNEPWLSSAVGAVQDIIAMAARHVGSENIILLGFSQGACLTSEVAALNAQKYKKIIIFTGGVIGEKFEPNVYSGDFAGTPVYISNSDNDPHVPLTRTEETIELYKKLGANVTAHIFPNRPHTVTKEEVEEARGK
jgi:phospholipase/carboxylesterase